LAEKVDIDSQHPTDAVTMKRFEIVSKYKELAFMQGNHVFSEKNKESRYRLEVDRHYHRENSSMIRKISEGFCPQLTSEMVQVEFLMFIL
jgi:hypothetical protein